MRHHHATVTWLRHLVDPDGLSSLRLAVAGATAPMYAVATDRAGSRALPRPGHHPQAISPRIPQQSPSVEPTSDQATVMALVRAAQGGDGEAFGQLYDRYFTTVFRYVAYRVGDRSLAEDLTSETFLRALRRLATYSWQGRDFGAWLVTIARNLIADHFKSSQYKLELATSDLIASGGERSAAGPEDEVLAGITNELLLTAVKKLGPDQQECIVLRFLQGLSVAETAAVLGKKDDAVKALQYRAVRALARLLPTELAA